MAKIPYPYRHAYRVARLEPGNAVVIDVNMRIVGRDIEMLHSMVTGLQFAIKLNTLGLACGGCLHRYLVRVWRRGARDFRVATVGASDSTVHRFGKLM